MTITCMPTDVLQLSISTNMAISNNWKIHTYWSFRKFVIISSNDQFARHGTTINKTVRDAIWNFALTPRGVQSIISGRRLILKAIYPVANFIVYANHEEAIICESFINAKDPLQRDYIMICILIPVPRFCKKYIEFRNGC